MNMRQLRRTTRKLEENMMSYEKKRKKKIDKDKKNKERKKEKN